MAVVRTRGLMSVGTGVEKTVVAQMVVRVGNQNAEYDSPPQRAHVLFRRRAVLTERVHELEIAARLVVVGAEHARGGQKGQSHGTRPVEAAQQENWPAGNIFNAPGRHRDAGLGSKGQGHGLPPDRVDLISLVRKLRDRQMTVAVADRSLGSRAAQ